MARYSTIPITQGLDPLTNPKDLKPRYVNLKYPDIPTSVEDIYVFTSEGDRYDILAQTYYKDSSLWWIISVANTFRQGSLIPKPGSQIRIPAASRVNQIISNYESLNI